ncbi:hypothetical protein [Limisalsivibrio acetivorans]|uniref:hypothetical protein n=1 Tax=Limisalsivibrio acetivorans TaxID=1304888 RepID=UPI0003B4E79E|nr:hypothetical protein [Limisalsivibrio acetivorans]
MDVNSILIFLSGFLFGGVACTRIEGWLIIKKLGENPDPEEGRAFYSKLKHGGVFISVFFLTILYFLYPSPFLFGLFAGYGFFAFKPGA